jgi:hypothetical protein
MVTFKIQTVTVNEPATGRGVDLKMETLLRISCEQQQVKFQELWWKSCRSTPFLLFNRVVNSTIE